MRALLHTGFFLPLLIGATVAQASTESSTATLTIEEQVAAFLYDKTLDLEDEIQVHVSPIATDVRPPDCADALQMDLRQAITRHRHTVRVQCPSASWTIHVQATLSIFRDVVVSQRALARKQAVNANDLTLDKRDITQLDGDLLTTPDEVTGLLLRRPVSAGTALTRNLFEQPQVIRKGDSVVVTASGSGIQVSTQATAMENARHGDTISVRNSQSGRTLQGVATAPGRVEISL